MLEFYLILEESNDEMRFMSSCATGNVDLNVQSAVVSSGFHKKSEAECLIS